MQMRSLIAAVFALCLVGSPAFAHIGLGQTETLSTGFFHPLGGLDHALAMVAVGLYAASLGGSAVWLIPATFVGTMVVGGALGFAGLPLPYVEQGIGLSVVVMGVAIAFGVKLPTAITMGLVGLFALFHGHAHGSEGAKLTAFLPYAAGFVVATTVLHVSGITLGLSFDRLGSAPSAFLRQAAGTIGAIAGVSFLAGWFPT